MWEKLKRSIPAVRPPNQETSAIRMESTRSCVMICIRECCCLLLTMASCLCGCSVRLESQESQFCCGKLTKGFSFKIRRCECKLRITIPDLHHLHLVDQVISSLKVNKQQQRSKLATFTAARSSPEHQGMPTIPWYAPCRCPTCPIQVPYRSTRSVNNSYPEGFHHVSPLRYFKSLRAADFVARGWA